MLLLLAYDGTDLAAVPGNAEPDHGGRLRRSVAGELIAALTRVDERVTVDLLSRTDAGVHATAQVAAVDGLRRLDAEGAVRALRRHLPADLRCLAACDAPAPRVVDKTYTYRLDLGDDPLLARLAWRPPFRVDPERLAEAVALLPGDRDFRAFARRGEQRDDLRRDLRRASLALTDGPCGPIATIRLTADGFVYRLARSLVGACVAVGAGQVDPAALARALAGEATPAARHQAPARGLCLVDMTLAPRPAWTFAR